MAYRRLLNWLAMGTCWEATLLRSLWMADWVIVSLKTQTFGPRAATYASGQAGMAATADRAAAAGTAALADVT